MTKCISRLPRIIPWCLSGWLLASATAQQTTADLENAVRYYARDVKAMQERVDNVNARLKTVDDNLETQLAILLDALCSATDSADSGSKVLQIKESMYDALKRNLNFLVGERGTRFAALYQQSRRLSKEELADDVLRLNQRIEKRVDEVMMLVSSLPGEQVLPKQIVSYDYDDDETHTRTNPQYTHQNQLLARAGLLRQRAYNDLKASIAKMERSRAELERARRLAKTDKGRQFIDELVQQNQEVLARRRKQIIAAQTNTNPSAQPLGNRAASALADLVDQAKVSLKRDNADWIRLKNERDVERERLYNCQRMLTAYQQKLQAAEKTSSTP